MPMSQRTRRTAGHLPLFAACFIVAFAGAAQTSPVAQPCRYLTLRSPLSIPMPPLSTATAKWSASTSTRIPIRDVLQQRDRLGAAMSPLLINLAPGAWRLSGTDDPVGFDIDADGVLNTITWTARDSAIAFLAVDRNQSGTIDHGSELFGNRTMLRSGARARNGFEALKELDSNSGTSYHWMGRRDSSGNSLDIRVSPASRALRARL